MEFRPMALAIHPFACHLFVFMVLLLIIPGHNSFCEAYPTRSESKCSDWGSWLETRICITPAELSSHASFYCSVQPQPINQRSGMLARMFRSLDIEPHATGADEPGTDPPISNDNVSIHGISTEDESRFVERGNQSQGKDGSEADEIVSADYGVVSSTKHHNVTEPDAAANNQTLNSSQSNETVSEPFEFKSFAVKAPVSAQPKCLNPSLTVFSGIAAPFSLNSPGYDPFAAYQVMFGGQQPWQLPFASPSVQNAMLSFAPALPGHINFPPAAAQSIGQTGTASANSWQSLLLGARPNIPASSAIIPQKHTITSQLQHHQTAASIASIESSIFQQLGKMVCGNCMIEVRCRNRKANSHCRAAIDVEQTECSGAQAAKTVCHLAANVCAVIRPYSTFANSVSEKSIQRSKNVQTKIASAKAQKAWSKARILRAPSKLKRATKTGETDAEPELFNCLQTNTGACQCCCKPFHPVDGACVPIEEPGADRESNSVAMSESIINEDDVLASLSNIGQGISSPQQTNTEILLATLCPKCLLHGRRRKPA